MKALAIIIAAFFAPVVALRVVYFLCGVEWIADVETANLLAAFGVIAATCAAVAAIDQ